MAKRIPQVEDFEAAELFAAMIGKSEPETDEQITGCEEIAGAVYWQPVSAV